MGRKGPFGLVAGVICSECGSRYFKISGLGRIQNQSSLFCPRDVWSFERMPYMMRCRVFLRYWKKKNLQGVRAVLGHFIFVHIHPYMDGNGRMRRYSVNLRLASGGYSWTVMPVKGGENYLQTLEKASVDNDMAPLAKFISNLVDQSL